MSGGKEEEKGRRTGFLVQLKIKQLEENYLSIAWITLSFFFVNKHKI